MSATSGRVSGSSKACTGTIAPLNASAGGPSGNEDPAAAVPRCAGSTANASYFWGSRASSACRPVLKDTSRSADRPPISTATRILLICSSLAFLGLDQLQVSLAGFADVPSAHGHDQIARPGQRQ